MRNISSVLDRWGGWAASGNSGVDYSNIAAGFKGLLPHKNGVRLSCSDDDGLIIESCMTRLYAMRTHEYDLIVLHYIYQLPKRTMARWMKRDEKIIRVELQIAEGFIDGCLEMLDVKLDMDPEVERILSQSNFSQKTLMRTAKVVVM